MQLSLFFTKMKLIFRIYVESQFPPSTVNEAIEECLAEMDQYLRSIVGTAQTYLYFLFYILWKDLKSLQSTI